MAEGTIKKLTDEGFGFIKTTSDKDMFFYSKCLGGVEFDAPRRREDDLHGRARAEGALRRKRPTSLAKFLGSVFRFGAQGIALFGTPHCSASDEAIPPGTALCTK